MKLKVFITEILCLMTIYILAQDKVYHGKANKPEKYVNSAFTYEPKYKMVHGYRIHYVEHGQGDPVIFLHGIPTWAYLWRNVIDKVGGDDKRAIALDLLGYGKSDIPLETASFQLQYRILEGFLEQLKSDNIILVVNDLGSLLGLSYAVKNHSKIKGVVLIEAVHMPSQSWLKQLSFQQKLMVSLMRNPKRAERMLIQKNLAATKLIPAFTARKLNQTEKDYYKQPYENVERRRIILEGPGPANFPSKRPSSDPEAMANIVDAYALKLPSMDFPIHLIYAKKGLIARRKSVLYARENFKNYTEYYVGKGKHFLPESHPNAIAQSINDWYSNL